MPTDLTPDQITDAIAAEVAQRVEASHPNASPSFRRLLVRLYTLQAAGLVSPPGEITDVELGQHLGLDPRRVGEHAARGLQRLKSDPRVREAALSCLALQAHHSQQTTTPPTP